MDINEFKKALGAGGARPNQFQVILTWPTGVDVVTGEHQLLVTGASLPASTVNPAIIQYRGREVKLAGERIFDPWTITVVNDSDFTLRKSFEQWMELMNSKESNTGELRHETYQKNLEVLHLSRNMAGADHGSALSGGHYTLHEAFPINMSEIALQYAQNDIIEEFTVTFQFQHYTVEGETIFSHDEG